MEYRKIKDEDKQKDGKNDAESLRGKALSFGVPLINAGTVGGSVGDRPQWKCKPGVTLALTVLTSSQAILIVWSKRAGKYNYSVTTGILWWRPLSVCYHLLHCQEYGEMKYYIFAYVDAPGYQIFKNFNIISTGVLYRIIFKRKLSEIQWDAFILLYAGCKTAQLNSSSDRVLQTPSQSWMMAIVMALLSGFAEVYTLY